NQERAADTGLANPTLTVAEAISNCAGALRLLLRLNRAIVVAVRRAANGFLVVPQGLILHLLRAALFRLVHARGHCNCLHH
ncbi:MAG: hypothetical protein ACJ8AI_28625, partial [Rhodopila sp.]